MDPVVDASVQDAFVLMLHDRLVELERQVTKPAVDDRVTILGTKTHADTGSVFVRVRSPKAVNIHKWATDVVTKLGTLDQTRWDLWACQHWNLNHEYVTEAVIQRSGDRMVEVHKVAHACLDALRDVTVETCALTCAEYFIESIRHASTGLALFTWDPLGQGVVISDDRVTNEDTKAWTLLHGFLASRVDVTDVWHPKALHASTAATELVSVLTNVLATHA